MEDKTLPPEGISGGPTTSDPSERRAFLRRAVAVGVPVVLATVRGRSVLAQTTDPRQLRAARRPAHRAGASGTRRTIALPLIMVRVSRRQRLKHRPAS